MTPLAGPLWHRPKNGRVGLAAFEVLPLRMLQPRASKTSESVTNHLSLLKRRVVRWGVGPELSGLTVLGEAWPGLASPLRWESCPRRQGESRSQQRDAALGRPGPALTGLHVCRLIPAVCQDRVPWTLRAQTPRLRLSGSPSSFAPPGPPCGGPPTWGIIRDPQLGGGGGPTSQNSARRVKLSVTLCALHETACVSVPRTVSSQQGTGRVRSLPCLSLSSAEITPLFGTTSPIACAPLNSSSLGAACPHPSHLTPVVSSCKAERSPLIGRIVRTNALSRINHHGHRHCLP